MSCKVGNQTNSQDPQAVNSRVFVGNLNTFQCSKTDVERIFQRYGRIAGISMHKGYAFIQFTNPFDARSACLGEDGRLLWGQTLDVNMVAEPKAHQTGRKRQNIAKTGNDWDYYYDSYYAQVGFPGPRNLLVPPMKRARLHVPPNPPIKQSVPKLPAPVNKSHPSCNNNSLGDLKSYSTPDILICGNCRELFSEVEQLLEHKKNYCKLRFTCKCHTLNGKQTGEEPAALLCSQCKDSFHSAWDLMVHVQAAHMLNIYQLGVDPNNTPKDPSEMKEGENGGCSSSNGSVMDRGSPNGFNVNGPLISDNLMEDSHSQTDLNLSSPNHRSESCVPILETRLSICGSSSTSTGTSTNSISTSTSTSNENGLLYNREGALSEMISLRNGQGRKEDISSGCDGIGINLVNGNGLCGGNTIGGCINNNNNTSFSSPFSSISSTSGGIGQVSNHSSSPIFYSQPMEANSTSTSTQTSHSDSLLPTLSNVNSSAGGNSFGDELCGIVSSIKSETSVHLPLVNGQVAGI